MSDATPAERLLQPIWKVDGRDRQGHWATEVESLGQAGVVSLVTDALDALLPEPLGHVLEREERERGAARAQLDAWQERTA